MTSSRTKTMAAELVVSAPRPLTPGVVYISERFRTALHLCCCGCGTEVVTPLNPAGWSYRLRNGKVSLFPSIGNWSLPCRSHYYIIDGQVQWATQMTEAQIRRVKQRDAADSQTMINLQNKHKVSVPAKPGASFVFRVLKWFSR